MGRIAAHESTVYMSCAGKLFAFDLDGDLQWSVPVLGSERKPPRFTSAPTLLDDGTAVVLAEDYVVFVGREGRLRALVRTGCQLDDSGPSPNLTCDGSLILTTPLGDVFLMRGDASCVSIGAFGYDIVPPAVCPDGSLVVSGYCGRGLVRVTPGGEEIWASGFHDADLTPVVSELGIAAAGSLNDAECRFYSSASKLLGTYPAAAVLAELDGDSWVALSATSISRVDSDGRVAWSQGLRGELRVGWGALGPAVDASGRIYFPTSEGVRCVTSTGGLVFDAVLGATPSDIALVGDGVLVAVVDGVLCAVT